MITTIVLASLAAGHGMSAAYLLRHLKLKPRPKLRHWQAASIIFPAGVIAALWLVGKQQQEN
ncbi:hypothetical protein [Cesiribacter sp. SM1]|uniref:hypothetical protein n=1 Tax=Cesiribacter sp. SM1 TaxID=2861196 RepID=UPI001CD4A3DE|nr:hypothetical protein [Cesiribacter sp. SM1]